MGGGARGGRIQPRKELRPRSQPPKKGGADTEGEWGISVSAPGTGSVVHKLHNIPIHIKTQAQILLERDGADTGIGKPSPLRKSPPYLCTGPIFEKKKMAGAGADSREEPVPATADEKEKSMIPIM